MCLPPRKDPSKPEIRIDRRRNQGATVGEDVQLERLQAKTLGLKTEKLQMKHPGRKARAEQLLKEKTQQKEIADKTAQFYES